MINPREQGVVINDLGGEQLILDSKRSQEFVHAGDLVRRIPDIQRHADDVLYRILSHARSLVTAGGGESADAATQARRAWDRFTQEPATVYAKGDTVTLNFREVNHIVTATFDGRHECFLTVNAVALQPRSKTQIILQEHGVNLEDTVARMNEVTLGVWHYGVRKGTDKNPEGITATFEAETLDFMRRDVVQLYPYDPEARFKNHRHFYPWVASGSL